MAAGVTPDAGCEFKTQYWKEQTEERAEDLRFEVSLRKYQGK
jgi:hypothetical protein